ncbi:spermatogenesis-associated protein 7 isoform X2 [Tachysurus fulvidraco]|uniref:spermatogenesis-associated protein 7 isoform X2 n=1 Tax=Tachysurus fulvidraco TaxID=1234273 RepID=UPI001FEDBB75|nr:spermatogenesis-associated protein 7 isoform X2 [Tachysurus fulvidraco]
MGYLAVFPVMDRKRALCHGSTGKLINQRIIEDHMISHYKKLYSAKAAVDCSVPKSMRCNVKYIDQKRSEQIKKDASGRTQSARSLSQKSLRLDNITSCSTRNARPSARGAESTHFNSGGSVMSSPRFSTSFHCKQIVYPSQMGTQSQNCRPFSDLSYRSPKSQMHHFTLSCGTSSCQEKFKNFQDPIQKTYSGDILHKHAYRFTEEKPFTPRTLKTDSKSTLSTYRYYTPASKKRAEEKTQLKYNQPDNHHRSKQRSATAQDSPEPCSVYHECSDEEPNIFGHYGSENKFTTRDYFLSSSRVSPDGMRSPIMRKVTAEEEELMYLEFMTDVTNEIILRGIYSDRVLQRVFERHIDINKHRLAEHKMRHLLEALQNDLKKPPFSSVTVVENKESSLLHRHKDSILQQKLGNFTTEHNSFLSSTPIRDKDTWEPDNVIPTLDTTPVNYRISENTKSVRQEDKKDLMDLELDHKEGHAISLDLENHQINEEDCHQICADNLLDELSRNMAESLNVSDIHSSEEVTEQESFVKLSDDEF